MKKMIALFAAAFAIVIFINSGLPGAQYSRNILFGSGTERLLSQQAQERIFSELDIAEEDRSGLSVASDLVISNNETKVRVCVKPTRKFFSAANLLMFNSCATRRVFKTDATPGEIAQAHSDAVDAIVETFSTIL